MTHAAPRARARAAVVLAVVLALLAPALPASADSGDIARRLNELVAKLDRAEASEALAERRLAKMRGELAGLEVQLADGRDRVGLRVRALYKTGAPLDAFVTVLSSKSPSETLERAALVDAATRDDESAMRRVRVLRRQVRERTEAAEAALREIEESRRTLAAGREQLTVLLAQAQREEAAAAARRQALAEAARQRRIAAVRAARARVARERAARRAAAAAAPLRVPRGSAGYACLVGPAHAYSDTWGAPRSGGRRHQGVDVFAPYGSPVYAVVSGVIKSTRSNSLGGITLTLRGDDGDEYYYAHNSANLVSTGERVEVGEHIAKVGQSGNAQGTSPHVHFEIHPGGNAPVNPYPFVRRTCG